MKDGQLFGILSQSKIVRFFARHISEFDFGTLPISNLNLGIRYILKFLLLTFHKEGTHNEL